MTTEPTTNTTTDTTTTASVTENSSPNTEPSIDPSATADSNAPVVAAQKDMFGNVVPPAYVPNLKYKYLSGDGSNRVEKEFDEWMRPLLKDQESEKKLRELHERAYGLDFVKADRQKQKERADQVEMQHNELVGQIQQLSKFKEAGDYDTVFDMLGITEDAFLQHAVKVAQRRQNPQAQEVYNQQRQVARQAMTLEQENAQLRAQQEQYAVQMKSQELESVMSRQDIASIAQAFDDRVGVPGAFRTEVINRGRMYHALNGQDITAEQAVNEVIALSGSQVAATQQAAGQATVQAQGAVAAPQAKPVIPNISGKGTSPTKRIPKSTADLRQMAASMAAE